MVSRKLTFKASCGLHIAVGGGAGGGAGHVVSEDSVPHEDPEQSSSSEPAADST